MSQSTSSATGPTPRAFTSVADIENHLISVGPNAIIRDNFGRRSNFKVQAKIREAVRSADSRTPVGRIFQRTTPGRDAPNPKVDPQIVFYYLVEETTGYLYLLQTTHGGGTAHNTKYNVYLSDGTFTTGGWLWGLFHSTGRLVQNGVPVYSTPQVVPQVPAPNSLPGTTSVVTPPAPPASSSVVTQQPAPPSIPSILPPPPLPATNINDDVPARRTRAAARAISVPATNQPNNTGSNDSGLPKVSLPPIFDAPPTAPPTTSTITRPGTRTGRAQTVQPPVIPKVFSGVKKPVKTGKKPATQPGTGGDEEVVETPVSPKRQPISKPAVRGRQTGRHIGGGRQGTRSGVITPSISTEVFPKRSDNLNPATALNPVAAGDQHNSVKRKRNDNDDDISDEQASKRFKLFTTGWYSTENQQPGNTSSSSSSSSSLSGINFSRLIPAVVGGRPKELHMGGSLAQYVFENKRKLIKFEDAGSTFNLSEPTGKTVQVEVPGQFSAAALRKLRPALRGDNETLMRLNAEKAKADSAKRALEKKLQREREAREKKAVAEKVKQMVAEAKTHQPDPDWDW